MITFEFDRGGDRAITNDQFQALFNVISRTWDADYEVVEEGPDQLVVTRLAEDGTGLIDVVYDITMDGKITVRPDRARLDAIIEKQFPKRLGVFYAEGGGLAVVENEAGVLFRVWPDGDIDQSN